MNSLGSLIFFDLSTCELKTLFSAEPPWEILKKLPQFFSTVTFGIKSEIPPSVHVLEKNKIAIGKGCKFYPGSVIEGPCFIGDGVEIGPNAFIRPYSILLKESKVGNCSEIKESILFPKAKAPHFNYVGNSILGNGVNLGAGVVCANYKLDKTEVKIKYQNQVVQTGMKKLGAIIGDGSFIGCNTTLSPGTLLKKEFSCLPCSNIYGVHI